MLVCCGLWHTIVRDSEGSVWGFGSNSNGQLGFGEGGEQLIPPVRIPELQQITAIACGCAHSVCLDAFGRVWTFGDNQFGQLGLGDYETHIRPQQVRVLKQITSISCGFLHTICLDDLNRPWSFGHNNEGQLGLGDCTNRVFPQRLHLKGIEKVACGKYFTLFLNASGEVYGCGSNSCGELGLGDIRRRVTPRRIDTLPEIFSIACGDDHSIFLGFHNVYACGNNHSGQLGLGDRLRQFPVILKPNMLQIDNICAISCGCHHTMLLDFSGGLWTCGFNAYGRLGLGDTTNRFEPERIQVFSKIRFMSSGGHHSVVQDSQGNIWSFGWNTAAQLGVGDTENRFAPTKLPDHYSHIMGEIPTRTKSARN